MVGLAADAEDGAYLGGPGLDEPLAQPPHDVVDLLGQLPRRGDDESEGPSNFPLPTALWNWQLNRPSPLWKGMASSCSRQNMMSGRTKTSVFPEPGFANMHHIMQEKM